MGKKPDPHYIDYCVTVVSLSVTSNICCMSLFLFSRFWRFDEVFILRQKEHQQTWQAKPKDGGGGPHVHSCTHHSAVHSDPWPEGVFSSLHLLYISFYCRHLLSSPGQTAATQKVHSVIKTRGHQGPQRVMGVRVVPSQGRPHQCCKIPTAILWRCIATEKRRRETFVGGHFIAIVVTFLL